MGGEAYGGGNPQVWQLTIFFPSIFTANAIFDQKHAIKVAFSLKIASVGKVKEKRKTPYPMRRGRLFDAEYIAREIVLNKQFSSLEK